MVVIRNNTLNDRITDSIIQKAAEIGINKININSADGIIKLSGNISYEKFYKLRDSIILMNLSVNVTILRGINDNVTVNSRSLLSIGSMSRDDIFSNDSTSTRLFNSQSVPARSPSQIWSALNAEHEALPLEPPIMPIEITTITINDELLEIMEDISPLNVNSKSNLKTLEYYEKIIVKYVNESLHPVCSKYQEFSDFTSPNSIKVRASMMYVDKFFELISKETGIEINKSVALNLSLQNFLQYLYSKANTVSKLSNALSLENIQEIILKAANTQSVAKYSAWQDIRNCKLSGFSWIKTGKFQSDIFDSTKVYFDVNYVKNKTFSEIAEYIFEQQGYEEEIITPVIEEEPEIIETEAQKGLRIARIKFTENRLRKIKQKFINILPEDIRDMADATLFIAGGAIRDLLQFKEPKDYDFFINDKELQSEYVLYFQKMVRRINKRTLLRDMEIFKYSDEENEFNCVLTSNAISFGNMQIILKYCGNPEEVVGEFDFKQNMGYFYEDKVYFAKNTKLNEIIDNNLIFNGGRVRNLNNVLLRIPHFIEKGFKISKKEHAKILEAVGRAGFTEEAKEDIERASWDYEDGRSEVVPIPLATLDPNSLI